MGGDYNLSYEYLEKKFIGKEMFPKDITKIVNYTKEYNIELARPEAEILWEMWSEDIWCAQWLGVSYELIGDFVNWLKE